MRTLAVLASGQGTNFEALAHASGRGRLGGHIAVLVTDRPDAPALDRARRLGIETLTLPTGSFRTRISDESAWVAALQERAVDVVLLAGFMRRLHKPFLSAFPDRVLNVHPSLLPAFPGLDAIRQALEHGARVTGVTVHLVDDQLDGGPILAQAPVPIEEDDTLATLEARVHEVEYDLYPQTVRRFLTEPWRREGRRITFHVPTAGGTRG
jgi:phosphoribosylglycinamide formyltransferase-1